MERSYIEEPGKVGHRLIGCHLPSKEESQACQPKEMNSNNDSESFVWKRRVKKFFILQEILR